MNEDIQASAPAASRAPDERAFIGRLERNLDIAAAILLSIATVATAWCVYQATGWSGNQSTAFAEASTNRIESTREFTRSMQILAIDAELFVRWLDAYNADDQQLRAFYESNLLRPEFLPYLNDWIASNPRENPDAQRNPLVDPAYQNTLFAESERLRVDAEATFETATIANETADDYILATVIFASVLFFGGISSKFSEAAIQISLVGMALLMFIVGVVQIAGLPVH